MVVYSSHVTIRKYVHNIDNRLIIISNLPYVISRLYKCTRKITHYSQEVSERKNCKMFINHLIPVLLLNLTS